MKKKYKVVGACILLIAIVGVFTLITIKKNYVDPSFATGISLKYYYLDKQIDIVVTDEDDIRILQENLKGISYIDSPSCGFSNDVSIKFSDGERELVLCPACDNCSTARIGDSNRYVEIKDRNCFRNCFRKIRLFFSVCLNSHKPINRKVCMRF